MDDPRQGKIEALIEPILAEQNAELVELTCRPKGRQLLVKLLVDKVDGVTIQDCARLNQRIGQALDAAGLIEESYTLEVSSPGLDRPLVTKRDFERAVGENLRIELSKTVRGATQLSGMLLAVQPDAIVLKTSTGNLTVPMDQIQSALKAVRW